MATTEQERMEQLNAFMSRAVAALTSNPGPETQARLRAEAEASGDPDWRHALDYLARGQAAGPAAPPAVTGAAEFQSGLRALLEARGPYSQEVADLLAYGRSQFPQQYAGAYQLVQTWRQSHVPRPGEAVAGLPPPPDPAASSGVASAAARGGGVLTVAAVLAYLLANQEQVAAFLNRLFGWLPPVTSPWGIVAAVAAAGALGGLVNGWLTYSDLVVPQFVTVDGRRLFMPGFLGNLAAGVVAAAATVGLTAAPASATGAATAPSAAVSVSAPGAMTRLTTYALVSAFVAGLGGANILSLRRDRSLLSMVAQTQAAAPADPAPIGKVVTAADALRLLRRAAALAARRTQPAPTGPLPKDPADRLALVRASVRQLLDQGRLAEFFARQTAAGQPAVVQRDGSNLDLSVLALDHPASPPLEAELQKLRVAPVVRASLAKLNAALAARGIDVVTEKAAIEDCWSAANSLLSWLAQAPSDWQLTPEQLG